MPQHTLYSLKVVRIDGIGSKSAKGDLYVKIKLNKTIHRTGQIKDDGKPASNATLTFAQPNTSSLFHISVKQSRKSASQDRLIGHVDIEEDVAKLLQISLVHDLERDLYRTFRSALGRKRAEVTGRIHIRLEVTDAGEMAEQCIMRAENSVDEFGSWSDKAESSVVVIGDVIEGLKLIIGGLDRPAQANCFLGLSRRAVSVVAKIGDHLFKNDDELMHMVDSLKYAFSFSSEAKNLDNKIEKLWPVVTDLLEKATNCLLFLQECVKRDYTARMERQELDSQKMEEHVVHFACLKEKLDSVISVDSEEEVDNSDAIKDLQQLPESFLGLDSLKMDMFKLSARPRCLRGTRTGYIEEITSRLFSGNDTGQNIVWLTGAAGSGKSTIATTISDICVNRGSPLSYLFFERGKDEYVFAVRAIAYKIAVLHPSVRRHVVDAVESNRNIITSLLKTQFEKLLLEPIEAALDEIERPIVIILDALDECGTSKQREDLVRLLTVDFKRLPSKVRILVTSRPESDIVKYLSSKDHIYCIELEHTSQGSRRDVDMYIREKIKASVEQGPPMGWEWDGVCGVLSDAADGLFIWASTVIKMVSDSSDPQRELRTLLEDIQSVGGGIDSLYAAVLEQSGISWYKHEANEAFAKILGVILFSKEALSGEAIESFLGLEEGIADTVLCRLRSVLSYEYGKPVHLLHASFADYLSSERSYGKPWNIDEDTQRQAIAERCFDVMSDCLHFNIGGVESSFLLNDDTPDLQGRIQKAIPRHLDYSCRFWAAHFCEVSCPDGLVQKLKVLAKEHLLYWFEALSLTNSYNRVAAGALYNVSLRTSTIDADVSSFLWAAYRLASVFAFAISQSAPQVYISAISLWKGESRVADHYSKSHPILQAHRYGKKPPVQCIKILEGHSNSLRSVTFSPDGKRVASGSGDYTIRVWDADSGEIVSTPQGHAGYINSVSFSPDGECLVSGSADHTVRIWNAETGDFLLGPLRGHTGEVNSVAFSPDGKRIVSCSDDKTVCMWNVGTGQMVPGPFEGHTSSVTSAVFSPDGMRIASSSSDGTIRLWNADTGEQISKPLVGHTSAVRSIVFSPNGKSIASGSWDRTIRIWSAESGELVSGPFKHKRSIETVAFSPDGRRLASDFDETLVCIWDAATGELVSGPFEGHLQSVNSISFSPDGKRIASGSSDKTIRIWDADSGKLTWYSSRRHTNLIKSVAFSPIGGHIISGSSDKLVRVWDAKSGQLVSEPFEGHTGEVNSVAFSRDGKRIVSGSDDGSIRLWDTHSGKPVIDPLVGHAREVLSVAFSPNGKSVASGSRDNTIRLWDVGTGKPVSEPLDAHTGPVWSIAFSSNGKFVVTGSGDKTILLWDAADGELVARPFQGHSGDVRSVAFSPDDKRIVSGSSDFTIRIWEVDTGKASKLFEGHTDTVYSVAFSPNKKLIASGSGDRTVRIWDAETGDLVCSPLDGHTDAVVSVAFSSDSDYIVSGSFDGTIRVWNICASSDIGIDWTLSPDGWVLGSEGKRLLWIPEDMRGTLWRGRNTAVFGCQFSTRLRLADSPLGEDWCKGFPLIDRSALGVLNQ